jgi:hypothetical protein
MNLTRAYDFIQLYSSRGGILPRLIIFLSINIFYDLFTTKIEIKA